MTTTNYNDFLRQHKTTSKEGITHTRIGGGDILPAKYIIPDEEYETFLKLYHEHVFVNNKKECLTEVQKKDDTAKLYVDLDFRYDTSIQEKQHTQYHIEDLVSLYVENILRMKPSNAKNFKCYVLEKENVNCLEDKTKDGLHLIFTTQMNHHAQQLLRKNVLEEIKDVLGELPLTNTYDDVLDKGLSRGSNNSIMYGSMKPQDKERYEIKYMYECDVEEITLKLLQKDNLQEDEIMKDLSVRVSNGLTLEFGEETIKQMEQFNKNKKSKFHSNKVKSSNSTSNSLKAQKWWDYAKLIDINSLENYEFWFRFCCIHKNILGHDDYKAFDKYCFNIKGYDEDKNKMIYDGIEVENRDITLRAGWKSLYEWAEYDDPEGKAELDEKYNEPCFNVYTMAKITDDSLQEKIDDKLKNIDDFKKEKQNQIKKEIKKMEEEQLKIIMKKKQRYFERFHTKICNPVCYVREAFDEISVYKLGELRELYSNVYIGEKTFVGEWVKQLNIKTKERIDFLPYPLECPIHVYNSFKGLAVWKYPAVCDDVDFTPITDHMKILVGDDEKGYNYLLNYLAHMVQRPGELPRVALAFRSEQGVGKNIFFENLGTYLLGNEYVLQTAEMDKVIGRFSMVNNKLMVIMDETSGKDSFSNNDKIKNIITAEKIAWERKGIDGIKINNCGRYIVFSNGEIPVKIEGSDRRFAVFECSTSVRNNKEYFKRLVKTFKDKKVMRAFYDYLMTVDISNWDSINDRPITKAYKDIQSVNVPIIARFLEQHIYKYEAIDLYDDDGLFEKNEMRRIGATDFYKMFMRWCEMNGFKRVEYNSTKFGRQLVKYKGIEKKRSNCVKYFIDFETLKEYLIGKEYMEQLDEVNE